MSIDLKTVPESFRKRIAPEHRKEIGHDAMTMGEHAEKNAAKLEKKLHEDIDQFLMMKGVRVRVRSRMDKRTTNNKGLPDFLFVYNSVPFAIEVKRQGEDPRDDQKECGHNMQMDGWSWHVVRSLQEVRDILSGVPSDSIKRHQ